MTMETKEVQIEVTEGDIKEGLQNDCESCPIARAIRKSVIPYAGIFVYPKSVFMYFGADDYECDLPHEAATFIEQFDNEKPVRPTAFPLSIPVEFLKKG